MDKSLTSHSDMPTCASIFVKGFMNNHQGRFCTPKSFVDYPPPIYKSHPEDPMEVDAVPLGRLCLIAESPKMIFTFLRVTLMAIRTDDVSK